MSQAATERRNKMMPEFITTKRRITAYLQSLSPQDRDIFKEHTLERLQLTIFAGRNIIRPDLLSHTLDKIAELEREED